MTGTQINLAFKNVYICIYNILHIIYITLHYITLYYNVRMLRREKPEPPVKVRAQKEIWCQNQFTNYTWGPSCSLMS